MKFLLSLPLLVCLFCSLNSHSQSTDVQGTWMFQETHLQIDSIQFDQSHFTSYSKQRKQTGDFLQNKGLLVLLMDQPKDSIVRWQILESKTDTLLVQQNQHQYTLRKKTSPPVVTNSKNLGISDNVSLSFESLYRGLIGMIFILGLCFLLSKNRRQIDWRLVFVGLLLQVLFAVGVLKVDEIAWLFDGISQGVVRFLNVSEDGARFVFGKFIDPSGSWGYVFAFKVLPTIVFFSAFTSVLYYLGILQKVVYVLAWVMSKTMRLSGAESLAAAANIFIGQTEAPLVVKPYLEKMTKSEILCLMVGGMATIAGGVLAAFIGFLGGDDLGQQVLFTKHLLTASVMSAPAAIVIAKMLFPEEDKTKVDRSLKVSKEKIGSNILDAISRGTTDGLKLAVNVGAMLLVFTALIAVINFALGDLVGHYTGLNNVILDATDGRYKSFSLEYILGNLFAPIAWLIGVHSDDMVLIGQLLGEKTILNEFIAYGSLKEYKEAGLIQHSKSIVIATYALCGFANFASIGIQIGGIGVLAPGQRKVLAAFGIKALIGGTCAALLTATLAGMLMGS